MPFKPGDERPEGAGRKKGTPNKSTSHLHELAEELGVNPFEVLLHFAKRDHVALGIPEYTFKVAGKGQDATTIEEPTISPELQQKAAKDACEYLFPKLKSIEHAGKDGTDLFAKLLEDLSGHK